MKRTFLSWLDSFQRASLKTAKLRLSPRLIAGVVMAMSIFLLGGGVYDILMTPIAVYPTGTGTFIYFYPNQLHEQFLDESIGIMLFYAIGVAGLFLIYQSTKYIRNPRQLSAMLRIGLVLLIIAFVAVEAILYAKLNYSG
jgi:hypothetical protein